MSFEPPALDMSRDARMKRARDMGFTTKAYHGTGSEFGKFGSGPVFATDNPHLANWYAKVRGRSTETPNVRPVRMRLGDPHTVDFRHEEPLVGNDPRMLAEIEKARSAGKDSVIFRNAQDGGNFSTGRSTIYAALDPSQVRSEFDPFDPNERRTGGRVGRAAGGGFQVPHHKAPGIQIQKPIKLHVGAIPSSVAGRTDHLPLHVESGSYVLPADVVSGGAAEGNTAAGFKHMRMLFGGQPYGGGAGPYNVSGGPYGAKMRAAGGKTTENTKAVPVVMAGGEFVLSPEQVMWAGGGDLDRGHKVLDEFVKRKRAETIQTLRKLPGPAK